MIGREDEIRRRLKFFIENPHPWARAAAYETDVSWLLAEIDRLRAGDRLQTIVDEGISIQPTTPTDQLLTILERGLFEQRVEAERYRQALEEISMYDGCECGPNECCEVCIARRALQPTGER